MIHPGLSLWNPTSSVGYGLVTRAHQSLKLHLNCTAGTFSNVYQQPQIMPSRELAGACTNDFKHRKGELGSRMGWWAYPSLPVCIWDATGGWSNTWAAGMFMSSIVQLYPKCLNIGRFLVKAFTVVFLVFLLYVILSEVIRPGRTCWVTHWKFSFSQSYLWWPSCFLSLFL